MMLWISDDITVLVWLTVAISSTGMAASPTCRCRISIWFQMSHWVSFVTHGGPHCYQFDEVSCVMFNPWVNKSAGLSSVGQHCQDTIGPLDFLNMVKYKLFQMFLTTYNWWGTIWLSIHNLTEMSVDVYRNAEKWTCQVWRQQQPVCVGAKVVMQCSIQYESETNRVKQNCFELVNFKVAFWVG